MDTTIKLEVEYGYRVWWCLTCNLWCLAAECVEGGACRVCVTKSFVLVKLMGFRCSGDTTRLPDLFLPCWYVSLLQCCPFFVLTRSSGQNNTNVIVSVSKSSKNRNRHLLSLSVRTNSFLPSCLHRIARRLERERLTYSALIYYTDCSELHWR